MFSANDRCLYDSNQLADVICQLRFPEILSIGTNVPDRFQELIRADYPRYSARKEAPAPKLKGTAGSLSIENQPEKINYQFTSADGVWRVNLTSTFISLACTAYTRWEEFAAHLDKPLAAFIKVYEPAFFERIGLRYINLISRKRLNIESIPYSELFQPCYLGPLCEEDVPEHTVMRCNVNAEMAIRGGCNVKITAGPAVIRKNGSRETEACFAFDQDLYMKGNIPVNLSAGTLHTLHSQAFPIFRGAITEELHQALAPSPI